MTDTPDKFFYPGAGIDVVFNLNSMTPLIRSSMIYDVNPTKQEITLAQTTPKIFPHTPMEELHITTLVTGETKEKIRYGLKCTLHSFQKNYPLTDKKFTEAIIFKHDGHIKDVNLRSAFRMAPNKKLPIFVKALWNKKEYAYLKDFSILDVSITGIGFVIPHKLKTERHPMLGMEIGTTITMGMAFKYSQEEARSVEKMACLAQLTRFNPHFNKEMALLGFHFVKMTSESEKILSRFIHRVQLEEIRQRNRY